MTSLWRVWPAVSYTLGRPVKRPPAVWQRPQVWDGICARWSRFTVLSARFQISIHRCSLLLSDWMTLAFFQSLMCFFSLSQWSDLADFRFSSSAFSFIAITRLPDVSWSLCLVLKDHRCFSDICSVARQAVCLIFCPWGFTTNSGRFFVRVHDSNTDAAVWNRTGQRSKHVGLKYTWKTHLSVWEEKNGN